MSLLYSASRLFFSPLVALATGYEVRGRENIPKSGVRIVASNHVAYTDPPVIGFAAQRELFYLAKEELFHQPLLGPLITAYNAIPIRRGKADVAGMARAMEVLHKGRAMIMFPEGTRSRDGNLLPARPGVGLMSVNTNALIVPCYLSGSDQPGKWLLRQVRLRVLFGRARTWQELAGEKAGLEPGRELYQSVGDGVMREIAALKASL